MYICIQTSYRMGIHEPSRTTTERRRDTMIMVAIFVQNSNFGGLTCMFQVRGRGGTFCPAAAAAAAAALACFVCCMICVIRSNCCRVRPSFPFPAGELGDGDLELLLLLLWESPGPMPFKVTEMLPVELVVEIVLLQWPMLVVLLLLATAALVLVVIGLLPEDEPYVDADVNWMLQVAPCGELASPERKWSFTINIQTRKAKLIA